MVLGSVSEAPAHFVNFIAIMQKHDFQLVVIPSMRTPINTIHYAKEYFGESHTIIKNVDKNDPHSLS